jgi:hypothetical protein
MGHKTFNDVATGHYIDMCSYSAKPPMQTFLDAMPMTKKKMVAA